MPLTDAVRDIFSRISERLAARRRLTGFVCADCYRVERCNLDPDDNCIARQEQIARGDWIATRRARALLDHARLF
jgi:hypothetical protein